MLKIMTSHTSIVSARLLAHTISEKINKPVLVTKNPAKIKDMFIRYGSNLAVSCEDTKFNSQKSISIVSNKGLFSQFCQTNNIYSPIFKHSSDEYPTTYPFIIRELMCSSGGKGIVVISSEEDLQRYGKNNFIWTPFIPTQFELRVHVLGGKIVKIFKKKFSGEVNESALPIRNLHNGYHFAFKNTDVYKKLPELVDQLCSISEWEMKFFTMDVGWDAQNKKYFLFEINSGSGLNTQTVGLYADFLVGEMGL